jgi:hypothetical protein
MWSPVVDPIPFHVDFTLKIAYQPRDIGIVLLE